MSESHEQSSKHRLAELLDECVNLGASDLHLSPGLPPYFRIQGNLAPTPESKIVAPTELNDLAQELCRLSRRPFLEGPGSIDGAVSSQAGDRFRFNLYRREGELGIAIRKLDDRFRPLSELGLPESLYDLSDIPNGLVIVAGPTGAGKSTTIATFIDRINCMRTGHIVTIEDPIEYRHESLKCLVNQRQVGVDTHHFQEALVASLRQDPDVILVGEIREIETIRTAITAAETGHLVFTTVHAGDCVGVIERLVSVFPADEQDGIRRQLSLILKAVICQHLLVVDGKQSGERDAGKKPGRRVLVSEILRVVPAVANLIALGKSSQIYSAMESGQGSGMQTLEQDLARLVHEGAISDSTAYAHARSPNILRDRLTSRRGNLPPAMRGRDKHPTSSQTRR